jgi:hypothetical protein
MFCLIAPSREVGHRGLATAQMKAQRRLARAMRVFIILSMLMINKIMASATADHHKSLAGCALWQNSTRPAWDSGG